MHSRIVPTNRKSHMTPRTNTISTRDEHYVINPDAWIYSISGQVVKQSNMTHHKDPWHDATNLVNRVRRKIQIKQERSKGRLAMQILAPASVFLYHQLTLHHFYRQPCATRIYKIKLIFKETNIIIPTNAYLIPTCGRTGSHTHTLGYIYPQHLLNKGK